MNAKDFNALLVKLKACPEAVEFAKGKSLQQAWDKCERSNWMLWLLGSQLGEKGWPDKKTFLLATVDCAQTAMEYWTKKYPRDDRPQKFLKTVIAYCNGKETIEEVQAARAAAWAAWAAAGAAGAAARAAARAAAWAAGDAAGAAGAAGAAAGAAAWAAGAAGDAAYEEMCNLIRERIPVPYKEEKCL